MSIVEEIKAFRVPNIEHRKQIYSALKQSLNKRDRSKLSQKTVVRESKTQASHPCTNQKTSSPYPESEFSDNNNMTNFFIGIEARQ